MEDASLQGGLVVCARWRLDCRLSETREGRVWEAENIDTHARVAIKFLARPAIGDGGARRRFEREVRSINKVRSPHVLPILDHGHTESGLPFVVTELLNGQDLGAVLGRERVLGLIETGRIVDQVCRGLSSLHAACLAHGDLRPENVFVSSPSERRTSVKLLGFGFASAATRDVRQLSPDGAVLGVGPFVSPEELQGQVRPDAGTDLWALGVLAYRMLTGVWPFDVHNWVTLARSIQSGAFIPVSVRRKDLPGELDGWFAQVLQPERSRRFGSVEDARVGFERIALVYTAGMLAQPAPNLEHPSDPARRSSIIVHPPAIRSQPGSRRRIAAWATVLVCLSLFALRDPLGWVARRGLETPRFMAGQLTSRAAAPPLGEPRVDTGAAAPAEVAVAPPQRVAASEAALMTPPPEIAPVVDDSVPVPRARAARVRAPRPPPHAEVLAQPHAEVLAHPPPEPRPRNLTAIVSLKDSSPDLPAPSHVYRGF